MRIILILFLFNLLFAITLHAQNEKLTGRILSISENLPIRDAKIKFVEKGLETLTDSNGRYIIELMIGKQKVQVSAAGFVSQFATFSIQKGETNVQDFYLLPDTLTLTEINITPEDKIWEMERLNDIEGMAIYAGKKNEVISIDKLNANTSTNNMRQIYSKVPGINIIENDAAGIQLSIATRGLNPNRTSEFNSRQNGYDISADPIGYAESYFTPPSDGLERIEIVRGAASLQYGSQFGGLLNFKYRRGPKNKPFEIFTKNTVGSFGFFNTFNSIGGTYKKFNYYSFYNYKRGDGWRENTGFGIHNAYGSVRISISQKIILGFEFTSMSYGMKQPGGLTDEEFLVAPRKSNRNRNWFSAGWNMPAVSLDYQINKMIKFNLRTYGLIAHRSTLGNIDKPFVKVDTATRFLNIDTYSNFYTEGRLLINYLTGTNKSSLLVGARFYKGNTHRRGGIGATGIDADFNFTNLASEFRFPSYNVAFFVENIFKITPAFSITPGMRYEILKTTVNGFYNQNKITNQVGQTSLRSFPLLGLGINFDISDNTSLYANISQNYNPISFGDIYVINTSLTVDPKLKDVKGYNADLGYRGAIGSFLNFDLGMFYMAYKNRIGNVSTFRTNFSDSRSLGFEGYAEINALKIFLPNDSAKKLTFFSTVAFTDARYVNNVKQPINNNKIVEFAPQWIVRGGATLGYKKFSATLQYSKISRQFSDATNATFSNDGITGIIPAYYVSDFSINYNYRIFTLGLSINNLTDNRYFTRRASGYPGPGIIPSEGRSFFLTLAVKI